MSTLVAQTISNGTVSTSSNNVIQGSAKAWVNLVGSNGSINGSFNISSVTRTNTGRYTINFTVSMTNANYAVLGTARGGDGSDDSMEIIGVTNGTAPTASSVSIASSYNGTFYDPLAAYVAIFR
jgi:hypothetical protein